MRTGTAPGLVVGDPGNARSGAVHEFAPAKVNLYLHVVGRRADGYHLLDSLVCFAEVGDRLSFAPTDGPGLTLSLAGPQGTALASEADNIVLRAARVLAQATGVTAGAAITLDKRLPVASGIGGGSADAAATLRGLSRLWGVALPPAELAALALSLGADVPVCLAGRTAAMGGIGERIDPAPALPPAWLVLVNPGRPLSTPAVFRTRAAQDPGYSTARPLSVSPAPPDALALARALAERDNDLTAAAVALEPVIGRVVEALRQQPGCLLARMSGSGATCFGLFDDARAAAAAAQSLAAEEPGWWTVAARLAGDPSSD